MDKVTRTSMARVVLANEPRLLRELIAYTLDRYWGKGIALQNAGNVEETIAQQQAEWLVLTLDTESEFARTYWLEAFPSLKIVRLARDGHSALVLRSTGSEEMVHNLTLQKLLKLLES